MSAELRSRPGEPTGPALPTGGPASSASLHRLTDDALLLVPDGPGPYDLVVFFHGAGGDASGGLRLVRDAVAARGLLALLPSSTGPTWDLVGGRPGPDVRALDALLDAVFARQAVRRVAFAGFSDGASYALSLGLANGDLVEAVLAFSPGFAAPPRQQGRPRVWVSHGDDDRVLPVDRCGRRVVATLRSAGYAVDYVEFAGGHVVPPQLVVQALESWPGSSGAS